MNKHTKRRKRRTTNATIRHGKRAKRRHRRVGGRTGAINSKRTPSSKRFAYSRWRPNPPGPGHLNLGV